MEKSAAAFLAAAALALALGQAGKAALSGALATEDAFGEAAGAQASVLPQGGEPVDWSQTSLGAEAEAFMQ